MGKYSDKIKKKYTAGIPGNVTDADYFYYDTAPADHWKLAIVCGGYEKCAPDFDINRNTYPYYFVKLAAFACDKIIDNPQQTAVDRNKTFFLLIIIVPKPL